MFWDADTWMLPPLAVLAKDSGAAVARFRGKTVGMAKTNAALYGYQGAMYPWETAETDGHGATIAGSGWSEQHISVDVANGVWDAALALGDTDYFREVAYPVLREVSTWIMSRGKFTARGFEVPRMGGPDESILMVDNNAFFNVGAMRVLRAAIDCVTRLPAGYADARKAALWAKALATFYVPVTSDGVMLPFDQAPSNRSQATPDNWSLGSLQYLWTHGIVADGVVTPAVFNATYKAEEVLRARFSKVDNGLGTGSVPCSVRTEYFICAVYGALASHFGDRAAGREILASFPALYMLPPYYTTTEVRSAYAPSGSRTFGHYMTNWGSHLSAVLFGLTGLRISNAYALLSPALALAPPAPATQTHAPCCCTPRPQQHPTPTSCTPPISHTTLHRHHTATTHDAPSPVVLRMATLPGVGGFGRALRLAAPPLFGTAPRHLRCRAFNAKNCPLRVFAHRHGAGLMPRAG